MKEKNNISTISQSFKLSSNQCNHLRTALTNYLIFPSFKKQYIGFLEKFRKIVHILLIGMISE